MTPTIFAAFVVLAGLLASRRGAIYWQVAFCLFGGTVAVGLPALGGAVILPAVLFLPFLVVHAWREQRGKDYFRHAPEAAVWLALAVFYGVITAIVMPRLFAGEVQVVAVDRTATTSGVSLLHPVSGNITQSGYALGAVATFCAMRALLATPKRLEHFRDAVLLLAALNVLAALLNIGEFYLGLPKLLEYVRTAYAVFGDYEVGGIVRIHGTFPETSAFSGFTIPLFAFCFSLWMHKVRPQQSGPLALILLFFLLISTSSTAYAGLAIYSVFFLGALLYRFYKQHLLLRAEWLVLGTLAFVVLLGAQFLFETVIATKLTEFMNITLFGKMNSASGVERGLWNRYAWTNFLDTYGFGVGLGTIRCSSFLLVLLSNLGVIGTALFGMFLKKTLVKPAGFEKQQPIAEAARQATIAMISAGLVASPTFDLGIAFYCYAAAASLGPELARNVAWRSYSMVGAGDNYA